MRRVPNPPKLPVIFAVETRTREKRAARPVVSHTSNMPRQWAAFVLVLSTAASMAPSIRAAENSPEANSPAASPSASNIVVRGTSLARGRIIREHAETLRGQAFSQLFGETHPAPWLVRCEIHVHSSVEAFARSVGGPPTEARGATSLEFSGDRVVARRIDVVGDGTAIVPDAIDHELIHVVLADHFVHASPPRWADEGLALLFDSPEKQRGHELDFQEARRRGLAWSVADLVALEDYPADTRRQRVFYGQSAALVRWLIARHDATTFIRFLDDAAENGMEAALGRHYGINSLASVSSAWKEVAPINTLGLASRGL